MLRKRYKKAVFCSMNGLDGVRRNMKIQDIFQRMTKYELDLLYDREITNIEIFEFSKEIELSLLVEYSSQNELKEFIDKFSENSNKIEERICKNYELNSAKINFIKKEKKVLEIKNHGVILGNKIMNNTKKIPEKLSVGEQLCIEGKIFDLNIRNLKDKKQLITFNLTDYCNSVVCRCILHEKDFEKVKKEIRDQLWVKLSGKVQHNSYMNEEMLSVENIELTQELVRLDRCDEKRVELHAHTQMSAMDSVVKIKDLVKRAIDFGHKGLAITDHGVAQGFPEAFSELQKYPDSDLKIIYGTECYLVDDTGSIIQSKICRNKDDLKNNIVAFDLETTGFNADKDKIIEIGAVKIRDGEIVDDFNILINPKIKLPQRIIEITGITDNMLENCPEIDKALDGFFEFCKDCILVAHNVKFDIAFLKNKAKKLNINCNFDLIDTLTFSQCILPELKSHKLDTVCKNLNISLENHHRAVNDAVACAYIYLRCLDMAELKGISNSDEINDLIKEFNSAGHGNRYDAILLAKNQKGLFNLYKLISESHLNYFSQRPRVPKTLLNKYRDGLIVGSACERGEVYSSYTLGKSDEEIVNIAKFYDYLEIQPVKNNEFLVRNGRVKDMDELKEINTRIYNLGKKINKPVVATCDVHFLDPQDSVFREIIMASQKFKDYKNQPPLYFRTTDEMLKEFEYLGQDVAYEVVITNTNMIADQIDKLKPIPDGTYPPYLPNADSEITEMCYFYAKEIYGTDLPEIVNKRIHDELEKIIKYGFAVVFLTSRKLTKKSIAEGYLVGSRGSVGSSFVAFLCGITEVNSLPPHYICQKCKKCIFITDKSYACGPDMPDKFCNNCQIQYTKDGYDIPFETFLGFDGDKEPDIDLNFSGEYQSKAHEYTEHLFGKDNVFRAGTIGTIADRSAYGFVIKYLTENNLSNKLENRAEISRLVHGCTGVKRNTGQHPGGVMILPKGLDIHNFCPIQYPADDKTKSVITTHFDYHSISGKLLKLDILGHDDPTVIKILCDLTGVNVKDIPLNDEKTLSLFSSVDALNITSKTKTKSKTKSEDINNMVGTIAIPEFGTRFVRQMLLETSPKIFSDLVRISGLSHGTNVWANNAQEIVKNKKAKLNEIISTRDDIMLYLQNKKIDPKISFIIMERVRKGKKLTPEYEETMRNHGVPEWYIWSCNKAEYLFPKAHAVAYVLMAFRIAYFKVHYPVDFYISYFTIRAEEFDASYMIYPEIVIEKLTSLEKNYDNLSYKDKNILSVLEVVREMNKRNIFFSKVDLYNSDIKMFKREEKENTKILPPLQSLPGLGSTVASAIVESRVEPFMSKEDLRKRAKVNKSNMEILEKNCCLNGLAEADQISFFEFMV